MIGSKPAQIPRDGSSLSTHENKTCEAKTYEEYLGTVDYMCHGRRVPSGGEECNNLSRYT